MLCGLHLSIFPSLFKEEKKVKSDFEVVSRVEASAVHRLFLQCGNGRVLGPVFIERHQGLLLILLLQDDMRWGMRWKI